MNRFLSTAVLVLICGCKDTLPYNEPPAASYTIETHELKIGQLVTSVKGATVTRDFFPSSGVQPLLGRLLIDPDHTSPNPSVVVLSHELWATRFGSSPNLIGRTIDIDGRQITVVGVVPNGFSFPKDALLWTARPTK